MLKWIRINNYEFNLDRMTSYEGDTGPYLQYAHARLCSLLRRSLPTTLSGQAASLTLSDDIHKASVTATTIPQTPELTQFLLSANLDLLTEPAAINLIRVLSQYPDVVQNTLKTLEPTTVMTYLFKMTHLLSTVYDVCRVLGADEEVAKARMAMYESARVVLNNGMRLLGLSPVERM
jgi:arginyl-tRNA synthetase